MPTQWPAALSREEWLLYWEAAGETQWQGSGLTAESLATRDLPAAVTEIRSLDVQLAEAQKEVERLRESKVAAVERLLGEIAGLRAEVELLSKPFTNPAFAKALVERVGDKTIKRLQTDLDTLVDWISVNVPMRDYRRKRPDVYEILNRVLDERRAAAERAPQSEGP